MNVNIVTKTTRRVIKVLNQNSPSILTGLSVAGFITTVVLAVKATPKALEILDEEMGSRIHGQETITPLTTKEVIELTWKCYIPTVIMGSVSIACIISANSINLKRNAALASLYSITDTALKEYQAKVVEKIGKNKEEQIRGDIAQERLDKNPINDKTVILTGNGDMLCYDSLSGRYFKSDIETIRKVQNDFNAKLIKEMDLTLNELYYDLGLAPIKLGDNMGWMVVKDQLEFIFSPGLAKNGQPCIVIDHMHLPTQIKP